MIDAALVRSLFHYDPDTGVFKRIGRLKCNGEITSCDFVGTARSTHGYLQYTVKDKTYDVHRLIFLYVDGEFPECDIDHIDGNRLNNKWSNLRKVTRSENLRNVGKKQENKYGFTGIGVHTQSGKYRVFIGSHHKSGFDTLEEAVEYRKRLEKEMGYTDDHFKREVWNNEIQS